MSTAVSKKKNAEVTTPDTTMARDSWQALGFPSIGRMRREFDELFGKLFSEVPALWNAERGDGRWGFDVVDEPDAYLVKAEAPGFDPKDFHVDLRGDKLIMQAKRSEEKKEAQKQSFTASEFYHSITIPQFVDANHIDASYQQGVLQVRLPKTEEGKGRRIEVKG